jgi:hypothetical protein
MKTKKKDDNPFENPDDEGLFKLISEFEFYDFFVDTKSKCSNIIIPDTVLFTDGKP